MSKASIWNTKSYWWYCPFLLKCNQNITSVCWQFISKNKFCLLTFRSWECYQVTWGVVVFVQLKSYIAIPTYNNSTLLRRTTSLEINQSRAQTFLTLIFSDISSALYMAIYGFVPWKLDFPSFKHELWTIERRLIWHVVHKEPYILVEMNRIWYGFFMRFQVWILPGITIQWNYILKRVVNLASFIPYDCFFTFAIFQQFLACISQTSLTSTRSDISPAKCFASDFVSESTDSCAVIAGWWSDGRQGFKDNLHVLSEWAFQIIVTIFISWASCE